MENERVAMLKITPEGYKALSGVESYLRHCGLEKRLIELVKMRASQINGCAFCLNMHSADARREGETEQRLYVLSAWRETPFFSPRERAALAWTEEVTRIAKTHASDGAYEELRPHFSDKEIADLTILIGMINLWNRIAISARTPPAAAG